MEGLLVKPQEQFPAVLESYTQQGQMFLFNAAQNLIQFGRVLVEAKPLVPRGQFESWVRDSFHMSERTAQQYMAVWKRFGKSEQFKNVQFSNLQKMLALPEGQEEQFAREHDLEAMTARQVEEAVQAAKVEASGALAEERIARRTAEERLRRMEAQSRDRETEFEATLHGREEAVQRFREEAARLRAEADKAKKDAQAARRDLTEMDELLKENQKAYDQMQAELLSAKSAIARGDAERTVSETLTVEDFSAAVRAFLGTVAQMPYMKGTFAQMVSMEEYWQWDELLQAVEDWAEKSRKALDGTNREGAVIDG